MYTLADALRLREHVLQKWEAADRAKAVVDWTWAGFTHERAGRISVRTDQD